MERKHIPKIEIGTWPDGGGWAISRVNNSKKEFLGVEVTLCCPECKGYAHIPSHSIDRDGTVNASLLCVASCGYHEFAILDDWDNRLEKPAGAQYVEIPEGVEI